MTVPRANYIDTGDLIPNFTAPSTHGTLDLHETIKGKWALISTHPRAFTPVCSTEIVAEARKSAELHSRGIVAVTLAEGTAEDHTKWASDLSAHAGVDINFPIVADPDRDLGRLLGTLRINNEGREVLTRTSFIIDPKGVVRWRVTYPFGTGRGIAEIIRVLDSLQAFDRDNVFTPADWSEGDPVLVLGDLELFSGDGYEQVEADKPEGEHGGLAALPYVNLFRKAPSEALEKAEA